MKKITLALCFCLIAGQLLAVPKSSAPTITNTPITEHAADYELELNCPTVKWPQNSRVQRLVNRRIAALVMRDKTIFMRNRQKPFNNFNNGLTLNYQVINATAKRLSLKFNALVYYAGAAHPQHWVETLNFDLATGGELSLADACAAGPAYLATLSRICIQDLLGRKELQLDKGWVKQGAGPDLSNFQCFNLTETGLIITFPEYQVAPYAVGELEVSIPLNLLQKRSEPL
ncbi:MAG: RsiV family protein [Candidatus Margulisiibacteriota bacterium]